MDTQEKLIEIVRSVSKKKTAPETSESLFDCGYLDSFGLPDMVGEIEKTFNITIPDSDVNPRKFDSIDRIGKYVDSRK